MKIYSSEEIVLGGLLKNRSNIEQVSHIIGTDYFQNIDNRVLFSEILEYNEQTKETDDFAGDITYFRNWLKDRQKLEAIGGTERIVELFEATVSGADAPEHARIIQQDCYKRQGADIVSKYADKFNNGSDLAELISGLQGELATLQEIAECKQQSPLKFKSLDTVESKQIQWLWPNRIPADMFSMLVGNPGIGKSFLTMYMTAQLTTGRDWPDALNTIDPGSVLLFSDEESLEYAIKPRLEAQGADCSKVFAYNSLELQSSTFTVQNSLRHLEQYLDEVPDCRMIVFDPITAYMGTVNANANAEVRGVLLGLQQLAQRRNITVIGISHFSKKSDLDAIYRTLGSTAFTAAARSVWAVASEKVDPESNQQPGRLFLPVKSNYSIEVDGLRFDIVDGQVAFSKEAVSGDIDRVMQGGHTASQKNEAKDWLKSRLNSETVLASEVLDDGEAKGFSKPTVQRAANDLGVKKRRSAMQSNKYVWSL